MSIKSRLASVAVFTMLTSTACNVRKCNDETCNNAICTADNRSVNLRVIDASGNKVILDSTVTTAQAGTILFTGEYDARYDYTVVGDRHLSFFLNRSEEVVFRGYQAGRKVAEADFVIAGDCCHVNKVSGPDSLVIPQ